MITRVDPELVEQSRRFRLCFRCDECQHFDSERAECSHGYPTEPHRVADVSRVAELVFCKEFELG